MENEKYKNVVCFYYGSKGDICTYIKQYPVNEIRNLEITTSAPNKNKKNNNKKGSKTNV